MFLGLTNFFFVKTIHSGNLLQFGINFLSEFNFNKLKRTETIVVSKVLL